MSAIPVSYIILTIILTCFSEKIRYIVTEHPLVTYYDTKYVRYANMTAKRYGRADPFYYVALNFDMIYQFDNNVTVDFYFFEFLSNRYRRGFVEMHFKLCDMLQNDKFFGTPLRQGKFAEPCPFPPGVYNLVNMTIPLKHIPYNFPFSKGRIYVNVSSTPTKEVFAKAYLDMEIREGHINKKNWVDT